MTDEERRAMETLSAEAERLRADPSFAAAVLEIKRTADDRLAALNSKLADATLENDEDGIQYARSKIIQQRATIEAITELATEIGNQVLRGKSRNMASVA